MSFNRFKLFLLIGLFVALCVKGGQLCSAGGDCCSAFCGANGVCAQQTFCKGTGAGCTDSTDPNRRISSID